MNVPLDRHRKARSDRTPVQVSRGGPLARSCVELALVVLSLAAHAQFNFVTNNGSITLVKYEGAGGAVVIPETLGGLPVTVIGMNAFSAAADLTEVSVPDTVTQIGDMAFVDCTSLTRVNLGRGVTALGYHALFGCRSLVAVTVAAGNPSFSSVGGVLFNQDRTALLLCPPRTAGAYAVPEGVTTIGDGAFDRCIELTGVSMPPSVTQILDGAFYACSQLADVGIGDNVTRIGNLAFYACTNLSRVTVPDRVGSIAGAFSDCAHLTAVTLGQSLTNLEGAFVRCVRLGRITVPDSVRVIGPMAFAGCSSLTNVAIPAGVTVVGDSAFSACGGLTGLALPTALTHVGAYAFDACASLTDLTLPGGVLALGQYAFRGCSSLAQMVMPDSVTDLGWGAFVGCVGLETVTIGRGLTQLGDWAFADCPSLTRITVDAENPALSSREGVLFDKDQATLIQYPAGRAGAYTVPGTVTRVADNAFLEAAQLTAVALPRGLTALGAQAFAACPNLRAVCFAGDAPVNDGSALNGTSGAIVYRQPGTLGWETTFGGRPVVSWDAAIRRGADGLGVVSNQFGFQVAASTDLTLVVEACVDLTRPTWGVVATNTLSGGSAYFGDVQWTNHPHRFYRLRSR